MPERSQLDILYSLYRELARIRWGNADKWSKCSLGHLVSSYFPGGPSAVAGFANVLNQINPMRDDGIIIHPNDLREAKKIAHIFAAIIKAYEDAGWRVVP
nr:hypothetical protein [uncultured Cohaesibacter sp.]